MRHSKAMRTGGLLGALSILLTYLPIVAEETPDSSAQVFFLQTQFIHDFPENRRANLLGRELIRQAILMAAREELRIPTFDQTLRETPPENVEVIHLFVRERTRSNGQWQVRLYTYVDEEEKRTWKTIWKKDYDYDDEKHAIYADIVPKLERDIREKLAEVLLSAGVQKKQPDLEPSHTVDNEFFEVMLGKIDFIAQFAAVRSAHQAIAASGETPELLGILVRGYANLALLIRHQYNAASTACTARSWLYAQRLMAATDQSELAIWHRAYAWALGGTLHHALADLEQLKAIQQKNSQQNDSSKAATVPPWANLIEPYCMSDRAATKAVGRQHEILKPWATRLWFDLTSTYQHDTWKYHAGSEVTELTPTAYGVYAEMARHGAGLGTGRTGAYRAPLAFGEHSPKSLDAIPNMPMKIREILPTNALKRTSLRGVFKDPDSEDAFSAATTFITQRLREESQKTLSEEPSWSALAYLLEEEQFVQVANYLGVSTNATEHSLADEVEAIYPLVKDHRYAGYIDSFRYNKRQEVEKIEQAIAGMSIEDPRGNMRRMFRRIWSVDKRGGRGVGSRAWRNRARNFTMGGLLDYYFAYPSKWKKLSDDISPSNVRAFNVIVPYSDLRIRFSVNSAKEPTLKLLQLWEAGLTEDATAYTILGKRFLSLEDRDNAAKCFDTSLKILPTIESARNLADLHWKKDFDKWKKAYFHFLESEDLGLQHARAHRDLAYGFAYYGLWSDAKVHAELAAETWSAWGLRAASYACEGLADWEESERWIRELSESYPSSNGDQWYFWCRRTGRGNVSDALQIAERHFSAKLAKPSRNEEVGLGAYRLLEGDLQGALRAYRKAQGFGPTFTCSLMIAQLARQLSDEKMREKVLLEMAVTAERLKGTDKYDEAIYEAGLEILELLISGDASEDRLQRIDDRLIKIDDNVRSAFSYFVGTELNELGKSDQAEKYWRRALVLPNYDPCYATLAGSALVERHKTSRPGDKPLDKEDLWPARQDDGQPE